FVVCAETKPKGITVNKPVIINCFNPINFIPMIFYLTFPDSRNMDNVNVDIVIDTLCAQI
ncbi:MAG: hypothetical protein ACLTTW_05305, partial [Coprobacter sp.]